MTGQDFNEIFKKVYPKNEGEVYIFKTAYGLIMLGEAVAESERRVIGTGITPDTYIGIRLLEEDVFYIRDSESDMVYDCAYEDLGAYNEKNPASKIFQLLNRITKSINVKGAEILFMRGCGYSEMNGYSEACAIGFSNIFCKNQQPGELLDLILANNSDFSQNAKGLISINAKENMCALIENRTPMFLPLPLSGYKTVIALTGDKPFKRPEFSKIIKNLKKEMGSFSNFESFFDNAKLTAGDLPEYKCAAFLSSEASRITSGAAFLKSGNLAGFGELVKQSAVEYMSLIGKEAKNTELLFQIASPNTTVCGIYKERGIYAIIADTDVDNFINKVGSLYEKKAGKKPEFYICASSFSGEVPAK